ncbi:gluconokinase [Leucobacter chromiisoli]|nr:gluconokinase [Leucobacter chromiisoli]
MGVSGAGKTTVGSALAAERRRPFIDADDLHPSENRRKMESGIPLDDLDRGPWISAVGAEIARLSGEGAAPVVACSALKAAYREALREFHPRLAFVYLEGKRETLEERLGTREHEYMPSSLLVSQLETLEPPLGEERVLGVDIRHDVSAIVERAAEWLARLEDENTPLERTI